MEGLDQCLKIAVIGAGISGITAAHILSREHDVTLFEKNDYLGGHTNTITVESDGDQSIDVDTGFIVCNPVNYPLFYNFLGQLGVSLRDSDMSFGFYCEKSGLGYIGPAVRDFLRVPSNLLNPSFVRMIWEQRLFNKRTLSDLDLGVLDQIPLANYLEKLGMSPYFIDNYLLPLGGAIWSSPDHDMLNFPALTLGTFLRHHGMLELSKRPTWQTVVGGSHAYIKAFAKSFKGKIRLNSCINSISRAMRGAESECTVTFEDRTEESFDKVVLSCHADESLALLKDPSDVERDLLGSWKYHRNHAVLHSDVRLVPKNKKLWASWNYFRPEHASSNGPVPITYYMNRLQGLTTKRDYFVTLNRTEEIDPETIWYKTDYTHPAYTPESVASQAKLRDINGQRGTYYCGAYMGYGFHEDGVKSATEVTKHFGVEL